MSYIAISTKCGYIIEKLCSHTRHTVSHTVIRSPSCQSGVAAAAAATASVTSASAVDAAAAVSRASHVIGKLIQRFANCSGCSRNSHTRDVREEKDNFCRSFCRGRAAAASSACLDEPPGQGREAFLGLSKRTLRGDAVDN